LGGRRACRGASVTVPAERGDQPGPDRPSWARVANYLLGGWDNFEPDRRVGDEIAAAVPAAHAVVESNRLFVRRAVTLAGAGQVVDAGCGFLSSGSRTHEMARAVDPFAAVAYVDKDLEVIDQVNATLARQGVSGVTVVRGDLRDPVKIAEAA